MLFLENKLAIISERLTEREREKEERERERREREREKRIL